ncbi:hypothetical protein JCM5296_005623 [Sporobolomyces johnsonii]
MDSLPHPALASPLPPPLPAPDPHDVPQLLDALEASTLRVDGPDPSNLLDTFTASTGSPTECLVEALRVIDTQRENLDLVFDQIILYIGDRKTCGDEWNECLEYAEQLVRDWAGYDAYSYKTAKQMRNAKCDICSAYKLGHFSEFLLGRCPVHLSMELLRRIHKIACQDDWCQGDMAKWMKVLGGLEDQAGRTGGTPISESKRHMSSITINNWGSAVGSPSTSSTQGLKPKKATPFKKIPTKRPGIREGTAGRAGTSKRQKWGLGVSWAQRVRGEEDDEEDTEDKDKDEDDEDEDDDEDEEEDKEEDEEEDDEEDKGKGKGKDEGEQSSV